MAVIQISRIQHRRGQKLTTGIPQLSSAELAWAVDTQELFIGNGTIAEGAPYIGNTRIITEHSNVFENAVYTFMKRKPDAPPPVDHIPQGNERKLQDKLDEYVSVLDYLVNDENDNILWAETFEAAIDDLCALTHKYRKVIMIPTGTYTFQRSWSLQSGVILRGETQANTILDMGSYTIYSTEASGVKLQNFTITGSGVLMDLTGLTEGIISDLVVTGTYSTSVPSTWNTPAIAWTNINYGHKVDNVSFIDCRFEKVNTCVSVTQTEVFETRVNFDTCVFSNCYRGILVNGVNNQSNKWIIKNCAFSDIYNSAISMSHGKNTTVRDSTFYRCSNGISSISSPIAVVIVFGDIGNNLVLDCVSDRRSATARIVTLSSDDIPEAINASNATFDGYVALEMPAGNTSTTAFSSVSCVNNYIVVDYNIIIGDYIRSGKLEVTIGALSVNPETLEVVDNYSYSTQIYNVTGPDLALQIELNAIPSPTLNSVILTYTNGSGHIAEIVYKVSFASIIPIV